jgi:hypothetical protein
MTENFKSMKTGDYFQLMEKTLSLQPFMLISSYTRKGCYFCEGKKVFKFHTREAGGRFLRNRARTTPLLP